MLTKKFAALLTLFVLLTPWVCAFEINPLFSDHMVLQRDMPIRIYGSGLPGERLTATFDGRKADATVNSDRSWQVAFPPMPASSRPGTIVVTGKTEKIAIKDVLVGDVWVCSGQSNMGWALWQTIPLPDSYPQASQLRLVKSQTPIAADTPQDKLVIDPDFNNSWQHATKEYADRFSAVSYYFGLNVTRELNVPIGLIEVTLSATGVQCWMPSEPLKSHPDYDVVMAKFKREIEWAKNNAKSPNVIKQYEAKNPSHLYNGMMHPVTRFPIKGMIWYQAENNVQMSDTYRTLFPLAIRSWRKVWGQGDFPFLFVQLPGFYGKTQWHHDKTKHWPDMRLSQEYALKLPNTGMAVTTDSGHYTDIHPKIKNTVGRRLALHAIALEKAGVIADGPIVDKIDKKGDTAFVAFKSVGDGLETRKVILGRSAQDPAEDDDPFVVSSGGLEGFEVSGQDGIFHPANARIVSADRVELKSDKVDDIADIRYAFAAF
ncbi:MAG: hypothetical protein KAT00_09360, partial [Planctomycetes bacterium]|nr:hypothetical protein [Planctomycetota bacterium]